MGQSAVLAPPPGGALAEAGAAPPGGYAFDRGVVERVQKLDVVEVGTAWEMGDTVAEAVPLGADDVDGRLAALAEATGVAEDRLRERRLVASRIAPEHRALRVAWNVFYEIALEADEAKRAEFLRMIRQDDPGTPSGKWTVNALRQRRGKNRMARTYDPAPPLPQAVAQAPVAERVAALRSLQADREVGAALVAEALARREAEIAGQPTASLGDLQASLRAFRAEDVPTLFDQAIAPLLAFTATHGPEAVAEAVLASDHTVNPDAYRVQAAFLADWAARYAGALSAGFRPRLVRSGEAG